MPKSYRFLTARSGGRARDRQAISVHGLRRRFNNLSRQVAGAIATRAITGHVTEERTEHKSHVHSAEKLRVADQGVALAGLRVPANDIVVLTAPASGRSGWGTQPTRD